MAEQDNKSPKKKKEPSVLDIARELEAKQQQIAREQAAAAAAQAEKERLAYEEQLRQDRLELIRLKQGVIGESETIHEERPAEKHYTLGQRIGNFFYHNKWWLGIACFFVAMTGYLTWQWVTTVRPDMIVLLLVDDDFFNAACNERIGDIFEQFIEDENGDGKVAVDVYYIPASEAAADNSGYTGNTTKLFAEFQIAEACIVISDDAADQFIVPDSTLYDLSADYGQYAQTEAMRFYLTDTAFFDDLEWDGDPLGKDVYIGIRSVRKTLDSEAGRQKTFDISYPALGRFIETYGTLRTDAAQD